MVKTPKGYVRRELTGDGRESPSRWAAREIGQLNQTKTKIKRQKKSEKQLWNLVKNS